MPASEVSVRFEKAKNQFADRRSESAEVMASEERYAVLLDGEYKHRLAKIEAESGDKFCVVTMCGQRLHMAASKVEVLPTGKRAAMQAHALGRGIGGTQASYVLRDHQCICMAVQV